MTARHVTPAAFDQAVAIGARIADLRALLPRLETLAAKVETIHKIRALEAERRAVLEIEP